MVPSQRYYKLSAYYHKISGGKKVHKVSVDAGFSCPNRDGKISQQGCIYCDNRGFSYNSRIEPRPVEIQIQEGSDNLRKRFGAEKFVVYFQAYTNTYASIECLRLNYEKVKRFKDVIGLSVATRPDCIDEPILNLLDNYTQDYDVWVEYGLQSIHNKTLKKINRGHNYEDFLKAIELTHRHKNIKTCVHVIIGLPGENRDMILETAKTIGGLNLEGIKIHPLHVIQGTELARMYLKGKYQPLDFKGYVGLACDFLEYLWPETVIQRISADCPQDLLVAPSWILDKNKLLREINQTLINENKFQGRLYHSEMCLKA